MLSFINFALFREMSLSSRKFYWYQTTETNYIMDEIIATREKG